jgi:hypothetical protein
MSNISTIYDYLHTRVGVILPTHKQLLNVNNINQNTDLELALGWGVLIGSGSTRKRFATNQYTIQRTFTITNTISIFGSDVDVSIRKTAEKSLYENQIKIIGAFALDCQLNNVVNDIEFASDAGIENIYSEQNNFIMLRSNFTLDYNETI